MNNILRDVDYTIAEIHHRDDFVLASKGTTTTNVITLDELEQVLHNTKLIYHLDPIFTSTQLSSYYLLMNILFTPCIIVLQIFMASKYRLHNFKFLPFPSYHVNETIVLSTNNTDLLVPFDERYFPEA